MTAANFQIEDPNCDYFHSMTHLIVYGYNEFRSSGKVYSREDIKKIFRRKTKKVDPKIELEDFLRNKLVKDYLRPNKDLFGLSGFQVSSGADEDDDGLPMGRVDISFRTTSATSQLGSPGYIFECKRLNKYSKYIKGYVMDGMFRFVDKQYYADSNTTIAIAGMIAFVEVDNNDKISGMETLENITELIYKQVENSKVKLELQQNLLRFPLNCSSDLGVSSFLYSYESKHLRKKHSSIIISIHHLLLDYYDLLVD